MEEAQEGQLDYFDGDWCDIQWDGKTLFWFFRPEDRALFTLTWLT